MNKDRAIFQLKPKTKIAKYMTAGNAGICITNLDNFMEYFYKIRKVESLFGVKFNIFTRDVNLRTGKNKYFFIGSICKGKFEYAKSSSLDKDNPNVIFFYWFFERLLLSGELPGSTVVSHLGNCGKCGRELDNAESIKLGFGSVCYKKLA